MALYNPKVCAILSYRDGDQLTKMKNIMLPIISAFEISKQSDDISTKGWVRIPKNLDLVFPQGYERKAFTEPLKEFFLRQGKNPLNLNSSEFEIVEGLQIFDSKDKEPYKWKSVYPTYSGAKNDTDKNKPSSNQKLNVKNREFYRYWTPKIYYGQLYYYNDKYDGFSEEELWNNVRGFMIDGELDFEARQPEITKSTANSPTKLLNKFKVGDLLTLRYGYAATRGDFQLVGNLPLTIGTSETQTQSFYITNIIAEDETILLELEGWTWMMRQIPAKISISESITIAEFLDRYIYPVILQTSYINGILTRDATPPGSNPDPQNKFGSKTTDNLLKQKIGPLRISITNMYDLLVNLKETYFLNFAEPNWLSPHTLYLSLGYGFRKPLLEQLVPGLATELQLSDSTPVFYYYPYRDFKTKDITKLNYNAYAVLVRVSSNNRAVSAIKQPRTGQISQTLKSQTTGKPIGWKIDGLKQDDQSIDVAFGDQKTFGMFSANDALRGQTFIRTSDNDAANIINIKLVGITDRNYLRNLAKKTYEKMKFTSPVNFCITKPITALGRIPGIFDIVRIFDKVDTETEGDYIITRTRVFMDTDNGFCCEMGLGVKFLIKGYDPTIVVDDADTFLKWDSLNPTEDNTWLKGL